MSKALYKQLQTGECEIKNIRNGPHLTFDILSWSTKSLGARDLGKHLPLCTSKELVAGFLVPVASKDPQLTVRAPTTNTLRPETKIAAESMKTSGWLMTTSPGKWSATITASGNNALHESFPPGKNTTDHDMTVNSAAYSFGPLYPSSVMISYLSATVHGGLRVNRMQSQALTNNSSTVVLHFSRLIRLMAHVSLRGRHSADWTTAVAPAPAIEPCNTPLLIYQIMIES